VKGGGRWLGSLGASLTLHGVISVLGLSFALRAAPADVATLADPWSGDTVSIDTLSEELPGPAQAAPLPTQPSVAAATAAPPVVAAPPAQRPASAAPKPAVAKRSSVSAPAPRPTADEPSTPRADESAATDANAALLAKVLGFQPSSGAPPEEASPAVQAAVAPRPSTAGGMATPAGVRNLPKAFTRALSNAAAGRAAVWRALPAGKVDEAEITVTVGPQGDIQGHSLDRNASGRVRDLVRRTLASLGAGQFALRASEVSAGQMQLRMTIRLSTGAGEGGERVIEIGFKPPLPGQDGKAYFTLGSGFHFEAEVREL
jgi:hypothetical protein